MKPRDTGSVLTFAGHLEELRRRLGLCLLALLLGVGIGITQVDRIIDALQRPAAHLLWRLAFFSPTEPFLAYMRVALLAGVIVAMPVFLWQLWLFLRSGLHERERFYGLTFIGWGSLQFMLGVLFAYVVLLPASLKLLFSIGSHRLEPIISIDQYLSFVTTVMVWCGVVFELPVVLWTLASLGIVTPTWLRQQRGYAILALTILAAIVTPTTDAVNLLLMLVPMILLYELSILVTSVAERLRRRPRGNREPP